MKPVEIGYWFEELAPGLVLYARSLVGLGRAKNGAWEAEDLVQEAFIRLARQRALPANVRAWMLVTIRNAALDAIKSAKRRHARDQEVGRARWLTQLPGADLAPDVQEVQAAPGSCVSHLA